MDNFKHRWQKPNNTASIENHSFMQMQNVLMVHEYPTGIIQPVQM